MMAAVGVDSAVCGVHFVLAVVINLVRTSSGELLSTGSFCIINPSLPRDAPGNSYYCPAYDDYGMANRFTDCCFEGTASADNQKCCEATDVREEEKWQQLKDVGAYVGIATGCLLIVIFVFTYCRSDTYACVGALQWNLRHARDACLDAICFCDCLKSKRKARRRLEATRLNQIEPLCDSDDDDDHMIVPMAVLEEKRQFWW